MRSVKTWPRSRSAASCTSSMARKATSRSRGIASTVETQIARVRRLDLLLAGDERDRVRAGALRHLVVDLARQQPQRQPDDAGGMAEHALDGEMGLAGVGRTEHGGDAGAAGAVVAIARGGEGNGHRGSNLTGVPGGSLLRDAIGPSVRAALEPRQHLVGRKIIASAVSVKILGSRVIGKQRSARATTTSIVAGCEIIVSNPASDAGEQAAPVVEKTTLPWCARDRMARGRPIAADRAGEDVVGIGRGVRSAWWIQTRAPKCSA